MYYVLKNPNFESSGFTKIQVLKLWGEIFYWAITVINLRECPRVKGKSRYEVFMKKRPNIQEIRLLPIFSFVSSHQIRDG
jgi:hypothetical protein